MEKMMNKVSLNGKLGNDPRIRTMKNGGNYGYFSLATNEYYKNKQGEWVRNTDWHHVIVWDWKARAAHLEVKRGNSIEVLGKLRTRQFTDKTGNKRYISEVVALKLNPVQEEPGDDNFSPAA